MARALPMIRTVVLRDIRHRGAVARELSILASGNMQFAAWRLSRQLREASSATRREAADGLMRLGPAATSWVIGAMRDRDPLVREQACSVVVYTVPERLDEAACRIARGHKGHHSGGAGHRGCAARDSDQPLWLPGGPANSKSALRGLCESLGDAAARFAAWRS